MEGCDTTAAGLGARVNANGVGSLEGMRFHFIGAGGAMLIIVSITSKVKSGVTLLIAGLMIGYLCHAVTSVVIAFAEAENVKGFTLWQLGSFS